MDSGGKKADLDRIRRLLTALSEQRLIRDTDLSRELEDLLRRLLTTAVGDIDFVEELQHSREFLDSLIENIPDMIFVKEAKELRFVRFNRAGEELLGMPRGELFGKNDYDFFPADQADFFTKNDRAVLAQNRLVEIPEEPIETRHRGKRLLRTKKIPVLDRNGNALYLLGISEDITEKRAIDEELKAAKEAAEAASHAKSAFLANMSHEIRTPMNGLVGMLEILSETALSVEQQEYLSTIRACSDSLLYIINDILDFSKIEAGKLQFQSQRFDLHSVLRETTAVFTAAAAEKNVRLKESIAPEVPNWIVGDRFRLRQIITNLISNAVKFTESGGEVTLHATLQQNLDEMALVRFSVSDTGIGISEGAIQKIFTPFTQADTSPSRAFGGTGLGLSISSRLVTLMGGRLEVQSAAGRGSEFYFTLPLYEERRPEETVISDNPGDAGPNGQRRMGLRILLAEDNSVNVRVAKKILEAAGHSVVVASNGEEVLTVVRKDSFDVILMDIQMPVMDGYSTAREIRRFEALDESPGTKRTPIIALTAHAMEGDRSRCIEAGMDDYLTKPLSKSVLLARLSRL